MNLCSLLCVLFDYMDELMEYARICRKMGDNNKVKWVYYVFWLLVTIMYAAFVLYYLDGTVLSYSVAIMLPTTFPDGNSSTRPTFDIRNKI